MRWAMWSGATTARSTPRSAKTLLTGLALRHGAQRRQVRRPAGHLHADGLRARARAPGPAPAVRLRGVGFAEEEGQRYKATFLGSGALIGRFDPAWLDQKDADGVTDARGDAARRPAGDAGAIAALQRDPARLPGLRRSPHRAGPGAERTRPAAGHRHLDQRRRALSSAKSSAWPATPAPRRWTAGATPRRRWPSWRCMSSSAPRSDGDSVGTIGMLERARRLDQRGAGPLPVQPGPARAQRRAARCAGRRRAGRAAGDLRAPRRALTRSRKRCAPPPRPARPNGSSAGRRAVAGAGRAAAPHAQRRRPRRDEAARGDAAGHAVRARPELGHQPQPAGKHHQRRHAAGRAGLPAAAATTSPANAYCT